MTTYGDNRLRGFEPFPNFTREMSMTAGLLCLFGFINLVPGVYDLVRSTTDGQDWSGDSDIYPPVVMHLAALIQITFSVMSMGVGFQWLVSGGGDRKWTFLSFFLSLFSFFTFIVGISYISFLAAKENFNFIPANEFPSTSENRSVAALAAIGYVAYAANNFGALIHLNFKMLMFQSEKWTGYNRGFYKKCLSFFGFLTLLAGVVQLALGSYVYDKVDTERLPSPVTGGHYSGPYSITYSEVAITFAVFQIILGCHILWRAFQKPAGDGENAKGLKIFQSFAWFVLLFSVCTQVLTQLAMESTTSLDTSVTAGFATQAVAYVVGLGLFPMYLDVMYYTTPETVEQGFFTCDAPWKHKVIDEERKVEGEPAPAATTTTGAGGAMETAVRAGETAV